MPSGTIDERLRAWTTTSDDIQKEWTPQAAGAAPRAGEGAPLTGARHSPPVAAADRHGEARLVQHEAESGPSEDEAAAPSRQMPLGIVIARIIVVSGMGFSAAFAIFFLIGALWLLALVSTAATVVFLVLMFAIERGAEGKAG